MKKPTSSWFLYRLFPTTYLSFLLTVLLFHAGFYLPAWWGWENGPLENTQVLILGIGLVLSWLAAWNNRDDRNSRNLWLWLTPCWLLCILRELSWGRVFYPISMGAHGPEFISLQQLWYGSLVKPLVAIAVIVTLVGIYRSAPLTYIRQTQLPLLDIVILFLAAMMASICEKNILSLLRPYHQVLEELAELTLYWSMVSIVIITGFPKQPASSKQIKRIPIIRHH